MNRTEGAGREVWVIDPSLFTLPYDHELCQALVSTGRRIRLIGRPFRTNEATVSAPDYEFNPLFYGFSDAGAGASRRGAQQIGKGIEHLLGMTRLTASIRRNRPDIVHFQWLPLPWADHPFLAVMARRRPLVLTVHDATAGGGRGFAPLQNLGFRRALVNFSAFIVHNRAGRLALIDAGVDAASIESMPHPPLPLPSLATVAKPNPDEPVLLIFGEIKPYKGIDLAIEALSELPERHRHRTRLVVAGKPHMPLTELQALARTLGVEAKIEWIDRYLDLDELPGLLSSATVFLLPYRESDASGVLAQVLQLGRPIIASDTGSFAELVGARGCGEVVEAGDAKALAGAVTRLLDDPDRAARMGAEASRLSQTMPGWNDVAEDLNAVYDRLQITG